MGTFAAIGATVMARLGGADLAAAIRALFASGEVGSWYDVSDLSSMFQDSSGTTPVTAVGQQVGKMLDKSGNGLHVTQATPSNRMTLWGTPTGANLVSDPNFFAGTDWTAGAGWAISAPHGVATLSSAALSFALSAEVGKTYMIVYSVTRSAGDVTVSFGGASGVARAVSSRFLDIVTATTTGVLSFTGNGFTGYVGDIRVYDASVAGAPYFLWGTGTQSLSGAVSIASYPLAVVGVISCLNTGGSPLGFGVSVSGLDYKALNVRGSAINRKESVLTASMPINGFPTLRKEVQYAEFTSGTITAYGDGVSGTPAANTNTSSTNTLIGVGSVGGLFMTGKFYGGVILDRALTSTEIDSIGDYLKSSLSLQAWGDSMTAGAGATVAGYPTRLGFAVERTITNKGYSGETSAQIAARFIADTSKRRRWINLFWMGHNDNPEVNTWDSTKSSLASCIAALEGQGRYLVLGPTMNSGITSALADELDSYYSSLYGSRFLNVRAYLQGKHDGSANDLADIAAGLVPRSLRADTVHLNDKGYQHVSDCVEAKLIALGLVDS